MPSDQGLGALSPWRICGALALLWCTSGPAFAAPLSAPASRLVAWSLSTADHGGRAFVVVDKLAARVHVIDTNGAQRGSAPALLGLARGDHTVPGIGERPLRSILPHERTTPAGRFIAEMGRNLGGEDVLWIDYEAAVSMHRVRASIAAERRLQRLASPGPADNRISFGCINVPAAFFEQVVLPVVSQPTVVYVLPDTLALEQVFPLSPRLKLRAATGSAP